MSVTLPLPGFEPTESDPSMSSAGASPAKTSLSRARVPVWKVSDPASGESTRDCLASFDPGSRSWRTSGLSGLRVEDLPQFSQTLPRSGMTRSGMLYLLPPLVHLTSVSVSGSSQSLLPTPTAASYGTTNNGQRPDGTTYRTAGKPSLETMARRGLIPTPTASDSSSSGSRNTPGSKAHPGLSLMDWARGDGGTGRLLPTPQAQDFRACTDYSDGSRGHSPQLRHLGNGRLNPRFVEWMMDHPLGWTDADGFDKSEPG